jgi:hypothetical protein
METTKDPPPTVALGLTRDVRHRYFWNDGEQARGPLPSVTTVLGVLDKSGPLVGWAKRETAACAVRNLDTLAQMRQTGGPEAAVNWLKAIPDYRRDSAADMGTRVHALVEQLARGVEPTVGAEEAPFVDAYRDFLRAFRPRFLAAEEMVVSLRHGYGGTLDAIAEIDGERWLLDVKTGSGIYSEAGLQMAAYAAADFIGRPGLIKRFRLPRVSRFGVVHVRPEGARLVEYGVDRAAFAAFLEARRLHAWRDGPAKSIVGKVLTATERTEAA